MENKGITITNNTTLGTLVTFFPDITRRLNDLHIDYCCHGNISIGEAIKEHRLSPDFLRELQDAYEAYRNRPDKSESVADMSTEDLIRLIIDTHHIPERQLWEEITPMLNKIMTVHYEHGKDLLLQLHRQFSLLRAELEEHFAEEECEVFPSCCKPKQNRRKNGNTCPSAFTNWYPNMKVPAKSFIPLWP